MKHLMQGFFSRVSGFVDTRGATWHGVRHYDRIKQNRDLSLQVPSGSALGRLVDLFALSIWNKLMFSYVACWASKWPKQECPGHTKGINADDVPPLHKTHHLTKHKVRGASSYCMEQYCTLEFASHYGRCMGIRQISEFFTEAPTHSVWVPTRWGAASSPTRSTGKLGRQRRGTRWPSGYGAEMGPVVKTSVFAQIPSFRNFSQKPPGTLAKNPVRSCS